MRKKIRDLALSSAFRSKKFEPACPLYNRFFEFVKQVVALLAYILQKFKVKPEFSRVSVKNSTTFEIFTFKAMYHAKRLTFNGK